MEKPSQWTCKLDSTKVLSEQLTKQVIKIETYQLKRSIEDGTVGDHPVNILVEGVRGTAWYSLATRGLVKGGGVGGGVGRMMCCNSYSNS